MRIRWPRAMNLIFLLVLVVGVAVAVVLTVILTTHNRSPKTPSSGTTVLSIAIYTGNDENDNTMKLSRLRREAELEKKYDDDIQTFKKVMKTLESKSQPLLISNSLTEEELKNKYATNKAIGNDTKNSIQKIVNDLAEHQQRQQQDRKIRILIVYLLEIGEISVLLLIDLICHKSVEVLPSGAPVLGCAEPSCVAHPPDDVDDSIFNSDIAGQTDGFFRDGDRSQQGYLQTNKLRANCSGDFNQLACTKKNQWVGGIEFIDHPRQPLILQCCQFDGLRFSQDVGVTTISAGEAVTGGEVIREGRQISFDVIANIRKVVDHTDPKSVSYEVTVRRMNCLPDPPEIETPEDEVIRVLEKANNGTSQLGHEGHPHMDKEKENRQPDLQTKRKPRKGPKNSVNNRVAPLNNQGSALERTEPFIGSFGAPIYNPIPETTTVVSPYPRHIVTLPTTTPAPPQIEPVITSTTLLPIFTFPTLPPFVFPTLPPAPPPFVFPGFPPPPVPKPLPSQPQAFGVSQANLDPLPPPSPFHHFHPFGHNSPQFIQVQPQLTAQHQFGQPFGFSPSVQYGVSSQTNFGGGLTSPLQQQHTVFSLPSHELAFPSQHQSIYGSFGQPPAFPEVQTTGLVRPLSDRPPGLEEKPELVEPSLPPTQQQLGVLFQPPPFPALSSALQNFQAQG
uniref:ZP domain-containing protein n=1 Tax=Heterorhabditis bacteriophora TaxID=37862 RepID=A0A1I7XGU8_HETBA